MGWYIVEVYDQFHLASCATVSVIKNPLVPINTSIQDMPSQTLDKIGWFHHKHILHGLEEGKMKSRSFDEFLKFYVRLGERTCNEF